MPGKSSTDKPAATTARSLALQQQKDMEKKNESAEAAKEKENLDKEKQKEEEKRKRREKKAEKDLMEANERYAEIQRLLEQERERADVAEAAAAEAENLRRQQEKESDARKQQLETQIQKAREQADLEAQANIQGLLDKHLEVATEKQRLMFEDMLEKTNKRPQEPEIDPANPPKKPKYHDMSEVDEDEFPLGLGYPQDDEKESYEIPDLEDLTQSDFNEGTDSQDTEPETDQGEPAKKVYDTPSQDSQESGLDEDDDERCSKYKDPLAAVIASFSAGTEAERAEADEEADRLIELDSKRGPAITGKLAKSLDKLIREGLRRADIKELTEKHLPPQDVESFGVPKLNREIWLLLDEHQKEADKYLAKYQRALIQGMTPMIFALKRMIQKPVDTKSRDLITESFRLLAQANKMYMRERRTRAIKKLPHLKMLTDITKPDGTHLFGPDLPTALKECNTMRSVSNKARPFRTRRPRGRMGGSPRYHGDYRSNQGYQPRYPGGYQPRYQAPDFHQRGSRTRGADPKRFQSRGRNNRRR